MPSPPKTGTNLLHPLPPQSLNGSTTEAEGLESDGAGRGDQGPDEAEDKRFEEALNSVVRMSTSHLKIHSTYDLTADALIPRG